MDYKDKNLQDDEEYLDIEVDEEYLDLEIDDSYSDTTDSKIDNLDENDDVFSNNINEINGDNLEGMSLDSSDGDFQNSENIYNSYSEPSNEETENDNEDSIEPSSKETQNSEKNNQNLEEKPNSSSDNDVQNGQKNTKDENAIDGKPGSSNPDSQGNEKNSENSGDTTKKPEESANSSENQFRRRGKDLSLQDKNFKNNGKNGYNPFNNLKKNNHNRPNDNGNRRNNQENNSDNNKDSKNTNNAQNTKQKALEESIRKYAQAHGIPKPIADKAAKLGSKKILVEYEKKKKRIKITLIAVLCALVVILIPILGVSDTEGAEIVSSEERSSYLYQNGSDEELYDYLVENNYCEDKDSCSSSEAANYYSVLRSTLNSNANLTKQEADIFITEMISYKRDNYFSHTDEIKAIADIIGSSKFYLVKAADYKEAFIGENGYFMTYRKDDLLASDSSRKTMENIYNNVVTTSKSISGKFDKSSSQSTTGYSICSGVTVIGENAGTYDLEDYVAKVVSYENDWAPNGNLEANKVQANKAQAIVVRTYVISATNNCTKPIENYAKNQNMAAEATQTAIAAAKETEGQILVDSNGKYILSEYDDAFCFSNIDSENYILCQQGVKVPTSWVQNNISASSLESDDSENHEEEMSKWGARYLASIGYTYDQILTTFYPNTKIQKLVSPSAGLELTSTGFLKRVSRALRDNQYIYRGKGLEGECAWYAVGRTNEILANIGSDVRVSSGGNGGEFCNSNDYAQFPRVNDVNQWKPGMVISWGNNGAGHVAIIEDVYYDSNGKVTSVDISEGGLSIGIGKEGKVFKLSGYDDLYISRKETIWNLKNGNYKTLARQFVCEDSINGSTGTGNGCQQFVNVPASRIKNRWSGFYFVCAMDLLG